MLSISLISDFEHDFVAVNNNVSLGISDPDHTIVS